MTDSGLPDRKTGEDGLIDPSVGPKNPDEEAEEKANADESSDEVVATTETQSEDSEPVSTSIEETGQSEVSASADGGSTEVESGGNTDNVIAVSKAGDEPLPSSRQLSIPQPESKPVQHTSFPYLMARSGTTDRRTQKNMRLRDETLSSIQDVSHSMKKKRYSESNLSEFDIQEAILWAGLWNLEDVDRALQMMGAGVNPDF